MKKHVRVSGCPLARRKIVSRTLAGVASLFSIAVFAQDYSYIVHKPTGWRFHSCSSDDGTAVKTDSTGDTSACAQWTQVSNGGYFHIQNRSSGKYLRPDSSDNGSPIVIQPSSWTGSWTQWSYEDRGDGYGHLMNRSTGKFVYIADSSAGGDLEQQPSSWRGDYTQWAFESANSPATPTPEPVVTATPTPDPTSTPCPQVDPVSYEAESGSAYGGAQTYNDGVASGGSGIAYISSVGAGFSVTNVVQGSYLNITYASEQSGQISVLINGQDAGNVSFTATGAWVGNYNTVTHNVNIPANATIDIAYESGDTALNVDALAIGSDGASCGGVTPTPLPTPTPEITPTPTVTASPTVTFAPTPTPTATATPQPSGDDFCLTYEGNGNGKVTHVDKPFQASFHYLCLDNRCEVASLVNGVWEYTFSGLQVGNNYTIKTQIDDVPQQCSIEHTVEYKVGGSCVPSACIPPDTEAPTVPGAFSGEGRNGQAVRLSWNPSTDNRAVASYEVSRGGSVLANVTETTYDDTNLNANTTYTYGVRACDAAGNCSSQATTSVNTGNYVPDTTPPTVPGTPSGSADSQTSISLSWGASTDAEGLVERYVLYRDGGEIATPTGTSYTDGNLQPGRGYAYSVSACDDSNNCSARSQSVTISTKSPPTPAPTPAALNLAGSSNNEAGGMIEVNGGTITTRLAERFRLRHESDTIHDQYVPEYADGSSYEIVLIDRPDGLEVQLHSPQTELTMVNFTHDHIVNGGFADPPQYTGGGFMHKGSLNGPADDSNGNRVNSMYYMVTSANGKSWGSLRGSNEIVTLEFTPRRELNGNFPQYYSDILRYRPGKGGVRFERNDDRYFSAGPTTNFAHGSASYEFSQAYMGIDQPTLHTFTHGREVFRASFLDGDTLNGLGGTVSGADPDAVAEACIDCHFQLGKGAPPDRGTAEQQGFINSGQNLRVAPQLIGLGLLDAVEDSTLQGFATQNGGRLGDGRYGWKASTKEIEDQVVKALANDMGVTNAPAEQILALGTYIRGLGVPIRRHPDAQAAQQPNTALRVPDSKTITDSDVLNGEAAFNSAGCNSCHIPEMQTGNSSPYPQFRNITIRPFTDMLLHDMGPELCAASGEGSAGACEWRTAPLWGTRLQERVTGHATFLHDGRATTRDQAIRAHGGDAQSARDAYVNMSSGQRNNLILYLKTL